METSLRFFLYSAKPKSARCGCSCLSSCSIAKKINGSLEIIGRGTHLKWTMICINTAKRIREIKDITRMFAGFTSLCTIPRLCRYCKAFAVKGESTVNLLTLNCFVFINRGIKERKQSRLNNSIYFLCSQKSRVADVL